MPVKKTSEALHQEALDAIADRDAAHLKDCLEQLAVENASTHSDANEIQRQPAWKDSTPPVESKLCSLLEYSVQEDFISGVWMLLQDARVRPNPDDVQKSFLYAMQHDLLAIVRFFLELALVRADCESRTRGGADRVRNEEGVTITPFDVLRHATSKKMYDLASRAIQSPCFDVNAEDPWAMQRPLTIVVYSQQSALVDTLLHRGATVDAPDNTGMTALMVAGAVASVDSARVLLQHGADANHHAPLSALFSPLKCLYSSRHQHFAALAPILVRAGLNVSRERGWLRGVLRSSLVRWMDPVDLRCHEELVELSACPQSLKMACLARIRRHLGDVTRGASILVSVHRLPLPAAVKDFLALDYRGDVTRNIYSDVYSE